MERRKVKHWRHVLGLATGCVLTAGFVLGGLYLRNEDIEYRRTAQPITAVVVGHESTERRSNGSRRTTHWEKYAFTMPSGQTASFGVVITGKHPRHEVGYRIAALYQPSNPNDARLDDDSEQWAAMFCFWLSWIGVVTAGISLWLWLRQLRAERTNVWSDLDLTLE